MANGISIDYCSGETSVGAECGWTPQPGSFDFPKKVEEVLEAQAALYW